MRYIDRYTLELLEERLKSEILPDFNTLAHGFSNWEVYVAAVSALRLIDIDIRGYYSIWDKCISTGIDEIFSDEIFFFNRLSHKIFVCLRKILEKSVLQCGNDECISYHDMLYLHITDGVYFTLAGFIRAAKSFSEYVAAIVYEATRYLETQYNINIRVETTRKIIDIWSYTAGVQQSDLMRRLQAGSYQVAELLIAIPVVFLCRSVPYDELARYVILSGLAEGVIEVLGLKRSVYLDLLVVSRRFLSTDIYGVLKSATRVICNV